ncbi:Hypothetical protein PAS_chr4_0363 [Komagataella phaffii GS115]|uniref:Uncharacterized protein n=1 Tax=Komagataella phaffii (strain GS115 / ATCC 20864) TaxID=644223 RepID=C4R7N1_KOMPG|nr:Hypothetical protein PAS_chr4_0363 [Komagataella phaffii GS115]CAY71606.1 Hypothetical protein PAS_chr4_0363 [Komagataella phaffii GS115]
MTKLTILLSVLLQLFSVLAEVPKKTEWSSHTTYWTSTLEALRTVTPTGTERAVIGEAPYEYKLIGNDQFDPGLNAKREIIDCEAVCCGAVPTSDPLKRRDVCECENVCCPGDDCETYVTTTQPWTGTYETTYTVPPSGTEPGTVVIETPEITDCEAVCCGAVPTSDPLRRRDVCECENVCCPGDDCETYVTTTQPWTGTYETTYTVPPTGTEPGTVVIETPVTYVTTTQPWTGTYETTYTIPPTGTEPGTVVIETPEITDCEAVCCGAVPTSDPLRRRDVCECENVCCPGDDCETYVTTTQPWTGTYETTYTVPPTGTEPGTVVIETPVTYVTTTQPWTGTYETTYTVPPTGTEPGTVVIETPVTYVTTTQPWTGTYETTYTVPPTGTEPGTVVIETPVTYVTTTKPWTGTYETTHTVPASGTEPGTVIIETPIKYLNTSISASTSTWTKINTVTQFISCPVCTIPKTITVTPKISNETVTIIISQPHGTSSRTTTVVKTDGASVSSHSYKTALTTDVKPEEKTSTKLGTVTTVSGSHSAIDTVTGSLSDYHASSIPHTVKSEEKASSTVTHTISSSTVYQVSPSNGASWLSVRLNTALSIIGTLFAAVFI